MKVNVEELSPTKKVMHVEIPEEDVAKHLEKAFKNLKASVNLRGFRPGKVPMSILERRFGRQVHAEVSGECRSFRGVDSRFIWQGSGRSGLETSR